MRDVPGLVDGYRRFLATRYPQEAALYRSLAKAGQAPRMMVIACCDSRIDPAAIFSAGPGQLFTVRNVANLVPPFEPHGDYHATSAALEFAVTGLKVEMILVMGHARCGGVRAFLDGLYERSAKRGFIDRWMSLLNAARIEALQGTASDAPMCCKRTASRSTTPCPALERIFKITCWRVFSGRSKTRRRPKTPRRGASTFSAKC